MKTASHGNYTLKVTLIEFEQLLQVRKWELVFTLQSHFVDFSHDHCTSLFSAVQYNRLSNMRIHSTL